MDKFTYILLANFTLIAMAPGMISNYNDPRVAQFFKNLKKKYVSIFNVFCYIIRILTIVE